MHSLLSFLKSLIEQINRFFVPSTLELDERSRRLVFAYAAAVLAPVLCGFGIFRLSEGKTGMGVFELVTAASYTFSIFYGRQKEELETPITLNIGLSALLLLYLLLQSGTHEYIMFWLYLFPVIQFLLLGPAKGLRYCLLFLIGAAAVLFMLQGDITGTSVLRKEMAIPFMLSLGVMTLITYGYELIRERYRTEMQEHQRRLVQETAKLLIAKQTAEHASHVKSQFLANMSHELRTPLNAIIGFTELILNRDVGEINDTQQEYLADVLNSGRHLLSLINDILDLAKVEAGRMDLDMGTVDPRELLDECLAMVGQAARGRDVELETTVDGLPGTIRADARKVKQVVNNLLSNAVKFTPAGGRVTLSGTTLRREGGRWLDAKGDEPPPSVTLHDGEWIRIAVTDTGIGILPEDIERIFEPFEQGDGSTGRRVQGTGLGLSLTRKLVALQGGAIWAASAGPNRGATLTCLLPLA
ncbi:MAG: sensor histidine kinase [Syntrophales bacterium]